MGREGLAWACWAALGSGGAGFGGRAPGGLVCVGVARAGVSRGGRAGGRAAQVVVSKRSAEVRADAIRAGNVGVALLRS